VSEALVVVRTGTANLASVLAALHRAGVQPEVTTDPARVAGARQVVLPGVGAFGACMARLGEAGLIGPLRERVQAGRPLLAVCLGLQVLARASEESPGVEGLGVVPMTVRRFRPAEGSGLRVPQLGWNAVTPAAGARLLQPGYAYYANSYRLEAIPDGWTGALSDHGGPFVAALERGPLLACQFHPELSGGWGQALLERWLSATGAASASEEAAC
jgi:imidazole glycerol phosphate synthase glutamine amidotransferase subunit